jgi:serine/threonine protein kinase
VRADSPRWNEVAPSQFDHEREALHYVRNALPEQDPYRAWSNFEFIADDGTVNEVDLLVVGPAGLYLVEIKSRPGRVRGDAGTWTWTCDGRDTLLDNPLLGANRKAKKLQSLLARQKACHKLRLPWIEPLVFLSAQGIRCQFEASVAAGVCVRDEDSRGNAGVGSLLARLTLPPLSKGPASGAPPVEAGLARAVGRALEEAGIRRSRKYRTVGDYELQKQLMDGPGFQDWLAQHVSLKHTVRRVRIYNARPGIDAETRETLKRAARREFEILQDITHPGIVRPVDYRETELGPALLFEFQPEAVRLEHFVAGQGQKLGVGERLQLLRDLAEVLLHAHKMKLMHRALSPRSVLVVEPGTAPTRVQILDWQTGYRELPVQTSRGNVTATAHLDRLIEDRMTVYRAPEAVAGLQADPVLLDVFALGAIAYFLFTGQPPADSFVELQNRLHEHGGLRLTGVADGIPAELDELIQASTEPDVMNRLGSVADFLDLLEQVEEQFTRPAPELVAEPLDAKAGDRLEGGFLVKKRLGKGAVSIVHLVERGGKEYVLKLALDPDQNGHLEAEGEILGRLRHHSIVQCHEQVTLGGLTGLLLSQAGNETLRQRLRRDGRLQPELLQRFGEDLLDVVRFLEQEGIPHRDLKPDNLGVVPRGRGDVLHLMLFDFSLSRTPPERIRAGTEGYLDPFLGERKPRRWDLHAERYAAAVTLHEMASGTLPRWGDGSSDPASIDCEVTLESELFEPELRKPLTAFFHKAFRRQPAERFDNAEEMLAAWRRVWQEATVRVHETEAGSPEPLLDRLRRAQLTTSLAELQLGTNTLSAFERLGATRIADLANLRIGDIRGQRGIGSQTRRDLVETIQAALTVFAEIAAAAKESESSSDDEPEDAASQSIERLAGRLLPTRGRAKGDATHRALRLLLGLDGLEGRAPTDWITQAEAARGAGVNYHHLEGGGFKDHPLEVGSVGTRPTPEVVRTL